MFFRPGTMMAINCVRPAIAGLCVLGLVGCLNNSDDEAQQNKAPLVEAGVFNAPTELKTVVLQVTASDPEGKALTYAWNQTGGTPVQLDTELPDGPEGEASFMAPKVEGSEVLQFEVTVSDGEKSTVATVDVGVLENNYVLYSGELHEDGETAVYLTTLDATPQVLPLTELEGNIEYLSVSADRRYVAFAMDSDSMDESVSYSLYVAEVGRPAERVLDGATAFADAGADGVGDGLVENLRWAPAGHTLAFRKRQLDERNDAIFSDIMSWSPTAGVASLSRIEYADADVDSIADVNATAFFEWSPDGDRIAYIRAFQNMGGISSRLYTAALDGTEPQEVSDFSQDLISNFMLYARGVVVTNADAEADGNDDMTQFDRSVADSDINNDGVADGSINDFGWSADGSLYYIADTGPWSVMELHTVNGDGTGHAKVTMIATTDADGNGLVDVDANRNGLASEGGVSAALWSPTAEQLAWRGATRLNFRGQPLPLNHVYTLAGTANVEVTADAADPEAATGPDMSWSPDGNTLVFTVAHVTGGFVPKTVYTFSAFDVASGVTTALTATGGETTADIIGWPANDRVLVATDPIGLGDNLWLLPVNGIGAAEVFESDGTAERPFTMTLQQDVLAFATFQDGADEYDLGLLELDSETGPVMVTRPGDYFFSSWSPDGQRLASYQWDIANNFAYIDVVDRSGEVRHENLTGQPESAGLEGIVDFIVFGPPAPPAD